MRTNRSASHRPRAWQVKVRATYEPVRYRLPTASWSLPGVGRREVRQVGHAPLNGRDLAHGLRDEAAVEWGQPPHRQHVGRWLAALDLPQLIAQPRLLEHFEDLAEDVGLIVREHG